MISRRMPRFAAAGLIALALGGCAYDYAQHTDRVAFSAGNAVKANLAAETTNPYRPTSRSTDGLGRDGGVIAPPPADSPTVN